MQQRGQGAFKKGANMVLMPIWCSCQYGAHSMARAHQTGLRLCTRNSVCSDVSVCTSECADNWPRLLARAYILLYIIRLGYIYCYIYWARVYIHSATVCLFARPSFWTFQSYTA